MVPPENRPYILSMLRHCARRDPDGRIFVAVRRDLKQDYKLTKRGTEQWMVYGLSGDMDDRKLVENSNFCIWEIMP